MIDYAKALLILSQICSGIQLSQFLEQDQFLPHRTSKVVREIIGPSSVGHNDGDISSLVRLRREVEENSGFEEVTGTQTMKAITEVVSKDSETEEPNEILVIVDHEFEETTTLSIPLISSSTVLAEKTLTTKTLTSTTELYTETSKTEETAEISETPPTPTTGSITSTSTAPKTSASAANSSATDNKPEVTNTQETLSAETESGIILSVPTEITPIVNQTVQNEIDPSESGSESTLQGSKSKLNGADPEKANSGKILTIVLVIICASMLALVTFGYGFYRYRNKDKGSYSIPSYTTGLIRSDHPL